jgi:hypothetical protein
VLLHLASDPSIGFDYGGGALTIVVPREDLKAGRYDRLFAAWQY